VGIRRWSVAVPCLVPRVRILCCVGSGFCDELVTRSEEPVCVCVCVCLIVRDLETQKVMRGPTWAVAPQKIKGKELGIKRSDIMCTV
jgi:hypothetical protein